MAWRVSIYPEKKLKGLKIFTRLKLFDVSQSFNFVGWNKIWWELLDIKFDKN